MRNMRINPGMLSDTGETAKYTVENAERADGQRETKRKKRKIGKAGFVRVDMDV